MSPHDFDNVAISLFWTLALVGVFQTLVFLASKAHSFWVQLRVRKVLSLASALQHSPRHEPILPLLTAMASEVVVSNVEYGTKDGVWFVNIHLSWWAKFSFGAIPKRIESKARALLRLGGMQLVDEECDAEKA